MAPSPSSSRPLQTSSGTGGVPESDGVVGPVVGVVVAAGESLSGGSGEAQASARINIEGSILPASPAAVDPGRLPHGQSGTPA
jgi:hypothetical protein